MRFRCARVNNCRQIALGLVQIRALVVRGINGREFVRGLAPIILQGLWYLPEFQWFPSGRDFHRHWFLIVAAVLELKIRWRVRDLPQTISVLQAVLIVENNLPNSPPKFPRKAMAWAPRSLAARLPSIRVRSASGNASVAAAASSKKAKASSMRVR